MSAAPRFTVLRLARWLWIPYCLAVAAMILTGLPTVLASDTPRASLALRLADTALTWLIGGLLYWRQGRRWTPLAVAYIAISHGANVTEALNSVQAAYPLLWPITRLPLAIIAAANLPAWASLPDGQFVPRFSRWLVPVAIAMGMVAYVPALAAPGSLGARLLAVWLPIWQFTALAFIFNRYFRHADWAQRQQLKWVVYGSVLAVPLLIASYSLPAVWPGAAGAFAGELIGRTALVLSFATLLFAILRSRLFDIDLIIRRTLVYTVLSGLLALLYFGSVVVFEALLRGLTDGGSQAAIVLSTLLIAALFGPLRGRVQAVIDRRFFRRKYDAARTLAAFSASVRDNVDLDALGQRLTAVVDDTMQPAHITLWAPGKPPRGPA